MHCRSPRDKKGQRDREPIRSGSDTDLDFSVMRSCALVMPERALISRLGPSEDFSDQAHATLFVTNIHVLYYGGSLSMLGSWNIELHIARRQNA